jgi:hypothetical protein
MSSIMLTGVAIEFDENGWRLFWYEGEVSGLGLACAKYTTSNTIGLRDTHDVLLVIQAGSDMSSFT